MRAPQPFWAAAERAAERWLRLEHGANVGPLLHVLCYYGFFAALLAPGLVVHRLARAVLWILLALTNYSLTVGVLHMHCHRPLFTARLPNRVLEWLLCFPSLVTAHEMVVMHVHHHHKHDNGPSDRTSTLGRERGLHAIAYWLSYGTVIKSGTVRELFRGDAPKAWRARRAPFLLDWGAGLLAAIVLFALRPDAAWSLWLLPLACTHVTVGYFAWLTHGPAGAPGTLDSSMNTVNNVLGLFIFNQGYHAVHHRFPGIHWTDIPDKLALLDDVDPRYIVPYWVTLQSAIRIASFERFRDPDFGARWKDRLVEKRAAGNTRIRWFPYFAWI